MRTACPERAFVQQWASEFKRAAFSFVFDALYESHRTISCRNCRIFCVINRESTVRETRIAGIDDSGLG